MCCATRCATVAQHPSSMSARSSSIPRWPEGRASSRPGDGEPTTSRVARSLPGRRLARSRALFTGSHHGVHSRSSPPAHPPDGRSSQKSVRHGVLLRVLTSDRSIGRTGERIHDEPSSDGRDAGPDPRGGGVRIQSHEERRSVGSRRARVAAAREGPTSLLARCRRQRGRTGSTTGTDGDNLSAKEQSMCGPFRHPIRLAGLACLSRGCPPTTMP